MKTLRQPLFLLLCLFVAISAGFSYLQYHRMAKVLYGHEIETVQRIATAVLPGHPELEAAFMDAVKGQVDKDEGENSLKQYGYSDRQQMNENPFYVQQIQTAAIAVGVFALVFLALASGIWIGLKKEKKNDLRRVLSVLEQYLSENYQFSTSHEALSERKGEVVLGQLSDTLKQLGNSSNIKNEKMIAEEESIKALVTDISHQLKTPIAALKLCFSMYLEADSDEEREEFLARSQKQMDQLEALAGSLVNISRMETAMIQLTPEKTSLRRILQTAVEGIYLRARKKQIQIETMPFDDIYPTLDRKWTTEAVMNVLDNAVKYSPCGSTVSISVQPMVSFVRIEISDEGVGIPKNEYNQIFSRFYRGADSAVKQTEGTGVGLYLTRSILEKQGGTIMVQSKQDVGSTFILQIRL